MIAEDNHSSRNKLRTVRILVYAILVLSAAATFFASDRLWAAAKVGDVPLWAPLVAPIAFTAFVVIYSIDRWLLVRRTRYPITRAFFQVTFALIFLTLLWPSQTSGLREARAWGNSSDLALRLLQSPNPDVRALACEVLGLRRQVVALEIVAALAEDESLPDTKAACSKAAKRLRSSAAATALEAPAHP